MILLFPTLERGISQKHSFLQYRSPLVIDRQSSKDFKLQLSIRTNWPGERIGGAF